ncbi:MAG: TetR family transcriptional regulator [Rhizobiales bacterium 32-66-8]|nr:MAG: TetR family transcriptional regulator [Rhizobiales bacterium 32-66-8]
MARTIGSNRARTAQAIRQAGVQLIYKHGYEAMSLRQLASEVGLQSGSLYKYFDNKQSLLFDIVRDHMEDLIAKAESALVDVTGARARLKAYVDFHLRYHMTRKAHVFIANMEIRSLDDEHRGVAVDMRRRYEQMLEDILRAGAASGAFRVPEPKVSTYAIISMLTGICMWYRPDGRLSQDELVAIYSDLVVDGVSLRPAGTAASEGAGLELARAAEVNSTAAPESAPKSRTAKSKPAKSRPEPELAPAAPASRRRA